MVVAAIAVVWEAADSAAEEEEVEELVVSDPVQMQHFSNHYNLSLSLFLTVRKRDNFYFYLM